MPDLRTLQAEFDEECRQISADCEAEGYPSHGSTYDLRVADVMRWPYYAPLFEEEDA